MPGDVADFRPIRGLEIVADRRTDRESTYCQALLYEQCLQIEKKYFVNENFESVNERMVGGRANHKVVCSINGLNSFVFCCRVDVLLYNSLSKFSYQSFRS